MNDADLHSLTGAYAANALAPEEEASYDEHLRQCASCAEEARSLAATTARLAAAAAHPAPGHLREQVLTAIQSVRQISPLDDPIMLDDVRRRRDERKWFQQPLGVAASLLAVVSLGLGAVAVESDRRADQAERIAAIATDPDARTITGTVAQGATAKVVASNRQGVFSARELPELPKDRDYQLWVIGEDGEGSARSVGVLDRGSDGAVEVLVSDLDIGDSVGLTIEPRGGSEQPTTAPLMVMRLTA